MNEIPKICLILALALSVAAQAPKNGGVSMANMALIPGVTFEMGTDAADIPRLQERFNIKRGELFAEEVPKHRVTIGSLYFDRTEVTNAHFKRFLEQNTEWQKDRVSSSLHNGKYLHSWTGSNHPAGQENYPVVFVTWYAATAYCAAQGKRLPTEAEWEYAARGGLEGKAFPWGDEIPDKTRANFSASELNAATAVARYVANGYGLHDMAGNVWEYLSDEWRKYPTNELVPASSSSNFLQIKTRRVLRGGSFGGGVVNLRVTYRDSHLPENAGDHVGFRCAMTAPVQSEPVNELLRMHYRDRAAHFNRDAKAIYAQFSDDYVSVGNGQVTRTDQAAGLKRMQSYFDSSTFLEWDDITPPIITVSNDESMASIIVHKKVRLLSKNTGKEEIEVFAWVSTLRKIGGMWKLTMVASTRTPEVDK
jgi:formylglycine-generating enzyme required for sulfatase activity